MDGANFDVGIMLFPSETEANATLDILRQTVSDLNGIIGTIEGNALNTLGSEAWIGTFEFEEVVFTQLGPFIVSGHYYWGYDWKTDEYREILFQRMGEAISNLGVIKKDEKLYFFSPPGGKLELTSEDLPLWALAEIVTTGAAIACIGPPDTVVTGDSTVLLQGKSVARLSDNTAHGGTIALGSDRIFVNGMPAAFLGGFAVCPVVNLGQVPHVGGPIVTFGWSDDPLTTYIELLTLSKLNTDLCTESARSKLGSTYEAGGALAEWCTQSLKTLEQPASKGDTVLEVDGTGIEIGDAVIIGSDQEMAEPAIVTGKGSLILDRPLENSYPVNTIVTRVPDEFANNLTGDNDDNAVDDGGGGGGGGCFFDTLR